MNNYEDEDELTAEDFILNVPIGNLTALVSPFEDEIWGEDGSVGVISAEDVRACSDIAIGATPSSVLFADQKDRAYHISRIAYFVAYGHPHLKEDYHPVVVDVGLFGYMPPNIVLDGNHRLAAAIIRGDTHIQVSVSGDILKARQVLIEGEDIWGL